MFPIERLNQIIQNTIDVIDKSRGELFDIAENAINECKTIEMELLAIKAKTAEIIKQVDVLDKKEKDSRYRLMMVSRNIKDYSEEDIKNAYERAKDLQIELIVKKSEEQQLIARRSDSERRLKAARQITNKAESLVSSVGVAMNFLSGGLQDLSIQIEDIKQKQLLGIKIIKAQEEERKRVAREIHDGPAQAMANLVMKAEFCEKLVDIDIDKAKDELKNLKQVVRGSLSDVRKIIYDLRPMSLDDLGLIPTLQRYAANYMEETDIHVDLCILEKGIYITKVVELAVFRIIQEALSNVRKHANAKNVSIRVEFTEDRLNVLISDDGKGFDKEAVKPMQKDSGYGLFSMKERIELLSGKFEITSAPGKGTRIFLTIPLQVSEEE